MKHPFDRDGEMFTCCVCGLHAESARFHRYGNWHSARWIVCTACADAGKHCSACGVYQPFTAFSPSPNSTGRGGVGSYCRPCRKVLYKGKYDPTLQRQYNLSSQWRMTPAQYEERLALQGGVCAVCKKPETSKDRTGGRVRPLSIDHDHRTGEIRGLLCSTCNRVLGSIEADMGRTMALLGYLSVHQHDTQDISQAG